MTNSHTHAEIAQWLRETSTRWYEVKAYDQAEKALQAADALEACPSETGTPSGMALSMQDAPTIGDHLRREYLRGLEDVLRELSLLCNRYMGTVEDYYLHGLWNARTAVQALKNAAAAGNQPNGGVVAAGHAAPPAVAATPNTTHEWPWIQGNVSIPAIILQKCEVWIGTAAHAGIQTHYEDGADTPNRTALLKLHAELRALLNTPFQRNAP